MRAFILTAGMMKYWKFYCMENRYPGLWHTWLRHQVVTAGWCSEWGFKLREHHKSGQGWNRARNCLLEIEPGHRVVAQLAGHRAGRTGEVVRIEIEDDQWSPMIPRSPVEPDGEQGRVIHVRWDLANAPLGYDDVVLLPPHARLSSGLARPTIAGLTKEVFARIEEAMADEANAVSVLPNFAYERSISDYIGAFPGRLEGGMTPYSSLKVRERVFDDGSRSDVLLLDRDGTPVVVECKQGSAETSHIKQLRHYMKKLAKETGREVRGILVHGGAKKLDGSVRKVLRESRDAVECVHYQLLVDFTASADR